MKPEIYKDHYEFEWDHRSHLTSALNLPIAVATVIGSALTVMSQQFPYHWDTVTYGFVALALGSFASIIVAMYFIFRALHGYEYQRIPTPVVLERYYNDLVRWHEQYGTGKDAAETEFDEYVLHRMAEAVEVNANNNKRKSAYIYRTNFSLAISLLFIGFSAVPFLIKTVTAEEEVYSIRIVNKTETEKEIIQMATPENDQPPKTTNQTPASPPPKPTPPPNEFLRESRVPPSTDKVIIKRSE